MGQSTTNPLSSWIVCLYLLLVSAALARSSNRHTPGATLRQQSINRFALRSRRMISTSRLKFVVSNHDIVLRSLRGGEIAIAAQNDVVSSIKENDNKVSAPPTPECRIQLKTDPSNIPLNTLLSNTYLSVPNANNGRTLFGLTLNERYHRLTYIYGQNELDQPPHRSLGSYIIEQFQDKLVRILLVVALISGLFGLLELKDEIIVYAVMVMPIL